jgi:hypothetical protein
LIEAEPNPAGIGRVFFIGEKEGAITRFMDRSLRSMLVEFLQMAPFFEIRRVSQVDGENAIFQGMRDSVVAFLVFVSWLKNFQAIHAPTFVIAELEDSDLGFVGVFECVAKRLPWLVFSYRGSDYEDQK